MMERYLRQSALAHLGLEAQQSEAVEGAAVTLQEKPLPAVVNLRGNQEDPKFLTAAKQALGLDLPLTPNTTSGGDGLTALWLGPDEWLILRHDGEPQAENEVADKLRAALGELHAAVTEVGESLVCIQLTGPRAADVIAKGCPLDLHASVFATGQCAQSHLAKTAITLHLVSDAGDGNRAFDLYTRRSFADYLWRWLSDAAREYVAV